MSVMGFKTWWSTHVVVPDPNPEYSRLDRMDGLGSRGVVLPAVDGTPAVHVRVVNGQAHTRLFDPTLGPFDARSSLERFPTVPRAAQPVIPEVTP